MRNLRRVIRVGALALLVSATAGAEVIDRILAVVDRELITMSDVIAAQRLGLTAQSPTGNDPIRRTLDALIERQLELAEANRYMPPEPTAAQIEDALAAVTSRFRTPQELEEALVQTGLTPEQLRLRVRDDLRIEAYLNQRFGAAIQPSEQEVVAYYRTHGAELSTGAGVPPLDDVRQAIRSRLAAARRAALAGEWLEGLRRRTEIADLYVSPD